MSAAESEVATDIQSSDRSVRDELIASFKEVEDRESEPTERARDDSGKFARSEPVEDNAIEPAPEDTRTPIPTEVVPSVSPAPSSWSNAAKAKWNALDPELRGEIAKREADVHKGFTKMDEERAFAKEVQKAVQPYEAVIRAAGSTVPQAIQSVLNTAYILRTADPATKARALAQVAQEYGVDLSQLSQSPQDPALTATQQRLAQLETQLRQQTQSQQEAAQSEVLSAIQAFSQDPKHPHFQAVQAHMGALMQAQEAKTMDEAYDMAIWARPDLRATLLASQQAEQAAKQQKVQKAQQARTKSTSVRGGPGGYQAPPANPKASVREDLEAAFAESRSRI